jgi:hypothetical protein
MDHKTRTHILKGVPLGDAEIAALRALVDLHGVPGAARRLGVAPNVVTRGAAGLRLLRGSCALIRAALGPEACR